MNLDLDLGTMELDERGMWIDPGPITPEAVGGEGPEVIPTPPGAILPGMELIPSESVQSLPVGPPVGPAEIPVPDGEPRQASYIERAPEPPDVTSISLPPAR